MYACLDSIPSWRESGRSSSGRQGGSEASQECGRTPDAASPRASASTPPTLATNIYSTSHKFIRNYAGNIFSQCVKIFLEQFTSLIVTDLAGFLFKKVTQEQKYNSADFVMPSWWRFCFQITTFGFQIRILHLPSLYMQNKISTQFVCKTQYIQSFLMIRTHLSISASLW